MKRQLKKNISYFSNRLLRIPRTRGFGVQSPTAYSFLRSVVNEHLFLQSYAQLGNVPSYPRNASRRERLIFRLRCRYPQLRVLDNDEWFSSDMFSLLDVQSADSVLLLLDLNKDGQTKAKWKQLIADKKCIQTFDLNDCGVIFFDNTKFKHNFKVNY